MVQDLDYYYGELGGRNLVRSPTELELSPARIRTDVEGGNILGRWRRDLSPGSDVSAQAYYDRTDREFGVGAEQRDTADVDWQHRYQLGERQEMIWGGGYRFSADGIEPGPDFQVRDPDQRLHLWNAFVQDEIAVVPDKFHFIVGTKLEHNDFTGFELQPKARATWMPDDRQTVWGLFRGRSALRPAWSATLSCLWIQAVFGRLFRFRCWYRFGATGRSMAVADRI